MSTTCDIPILDMSSVNGEFQELDRLALEEFAEQFGNTMSTIGFAYVSNHGVDMSKIDHIQKLSKEFFCLPTTVKNKYRKPNPAECFQGYAGPGEHREQMDSSTEFRELFDIWGFEQYDEKHFPEEIFGYKEAFDSLRPQCNNLAKTLLHSLGLFLKLEDDQFFLKAHNFMDDPVRIRTQTQFRATHYYQMDPTASNLPPNSIRCGEHSDWGTLTLLFQDMVGGLEVQGRDKRWIDATPVEDSILINAANLLELWSAGIFWAAVINSNYTDHTEYASWMARARTRNLARQSLIYFVNPNGDQVIKPIVNCPPGLEKYLSEEPKQAYEYYKGLISNATKNY